MAIVVNAYLKNFRELGFMSTMLSETLYFYEVDEDTGIKKTIESVQLMYINKRCNVDNITADLIITPENAFYIHVTKLERVLSMLNHEKVMYLRADNLDSSKLFDEELPELDFAEHGFGI